MLFQEMVMESKDKNMLQYIRNVMLAKGSVACSLDKNYQKMGIKY